MPVGTSDGLSGRPATSGCWRSAPGPVRWWRCTADRDRPAGCGAGLGQPGGQIQRRGRLAHAPLLISHAKDPNHTGPPCQLARGGIVTVCRGRRKCQLAVPAGGWRSLALPIRSTTPPESEPARFALPTRSTTPPGSEPARFALPTRSTTPPGSEPGRFALPTRSTTLPGSEPGRVAPGAVS